MEILEMLRTSRVIAVVGCSRDETKYSNIVAKFLQNVGYRIVPINPTADIILGEKVYKTLTDVPKEISIDIVDVFRPSEEAFAVAKQAVERGARVIWLQEGITSAEAQDYAKRNGIDFVQDRCTMKEYVRLIKNGS